MGNIFAGLESFGLKNMDKLNIFQEQKEEKRKVEEKKPEVKKEATEEELIFEKTYKCPVCDHEFKSKMVRTGKVRLAGADSDLRPKYIGVDSLKYDAVLCPKCGYAALNRYFNFIMSGQAKKIQEQISSNFRYIEEGDKVYSYDDAITRHKMALLNTVVKNGKNSEKAYTCLKLAWLYRGKREQLMETDAKKEEILELVKEEQELLQEAYEGFQAAFGKEDFPMCGMDQYTMMYLLAELARRTGNPDEAKRYVSKVLVARGAQPRIKNKALELKEKLQSKEQN
jgi:hypothetical protein